tara:strand:- start:44 stop:571 length:528 start_codon:yes stop_codon:yes gene_type:complete
MTEKEFISEIKKPFKLDDIVNYCLGIIFIVIGTFFFWLIISDGFNSELGIVKYSILFLPLFLLISGIYVIWRIPKDYIVNCIYSSKSSTEKLNCLESYFSQYTIESKSNENNLLLYRYYKNWWLFRVTIIAYIDEEKILFNAQGAEWGGGPKGVIDFGFTKNATIQLKNHLKAYL